MPKSNNNHRAYWSYTEPITGATKPLGGHFGMIFRQEVVEVRERLRSAYGWKMAYNLNSLYWYLAALRDGWADKTIRARVSQRKIGEHFGINAGTAAAWLKRLESVSLIALDVEPQSMTCVRFIATEAFEQEGDLGLFSSPETAARFGHLITNVRENSAVAANPPINKTPQSLVTNAVENSAGWRESNMETAQDRVTSNRGLQARKEEVSITCPGCGSSRYDIGSDGWVTCLDCGRLWELC